MAVCIKVRKGSPLSVEDVAAYVKKHLPGEKLLHYFKIVPDFPMTRSGKIQKFRLGELAQKEYAAGD